MNRLIVYVAAIALIGCGNSPAGEADANFESDAAVIPDASRFDAAPPADAETPDAEPLVYDCANLPQGPLSLTTLSGPVASEDLAFDNAGNLVGSNDSAIFKSPYNGSPSAFVPSFEFRAGLRYTSKGVLVVNDDYSGSLVRVDAEGLKHTILSGLSYPNGMEVDQKGFVYISEHDASRIRRVDPDTGEFTILSTGVIASPNGLSFNPDYTALYIGGFSGEGIIYKLPIDADGNPGELEEWATGVGTGWLDGLAVDVCGNVYVCDYEASRIYRIAPNGVDRTLIIDAGQGEEMIYMPNMQWGSGVGGWERMKLYIPEGWTHDVFEVDIGVPSKRRNYP